jgi:hypothetical protein
MVGTPTSEHSTEGEFDGAGRTRTEGGALIPLFLFLLPNTFTRVVKQSSS